MTVSKLLLVVLVAALALSGPAIAGTLLMWRKKRDRARKRSPLTADLLRPPGYSLRVQMDALRDKIDEDLILLVTAPLLLYSVYLTQLHFFSTRESALQIAAIIVAGVIGSGWMTWRLLRRARRLDHMRVGIDAEMFVGQELDQLMRQGAVVLHDVPAEKFNIDHLVIARSGVFAVETKGRAKPIRGQGTKDASVVFDGGALHFPGWSEVKPIEQAIRQAEWATKWLTRAVGVQVDVAPVLAIPGWWIDRKSNSLRVYNGKNPEFLLSTSGPALSDEMLRRIAYQVEQRCRTVKPTYSALGEAKVANV